MNKPKKICSNCHKIKGLNCVCPEKKPFEGINKSNYKFYNSKSWRNLAKSHKKRNPLCVICLETEVLTPVKITDHIIPIDKGGDKWNENNLQSLCTFHHNQKSGRSK